MKINEIKEVSEIFGTPEELIKCASLLRKAGYKGPDLPDDWMDNKFSINVYFHIKEYSFDYRGPIINSKDLTL